MFEAQLSQLNENRPAHPAVISTANHIIEELSEPVVWHRPPKFTPLALFVFGSALDDSYLRGLFRLRRLYRGYT